MLVVYCDVCEKHPASTSNKSVVTVSGPRVRLLITFEPYTPKPNWNICPKCRAEALAEAVPTIEAEKVAEPQEVVAPTGGVHALDSSTKA